MIKSKLLLALSLPIPILIGCGGGDADKNVVRNLFAIGEIVEAEEDGGSVEGDVSENDQGEGLSYALDTSTISGNGTLVFNSDGSFIYTPNADYSGDDSYTYTVAQESTGESDSAVLIMRVESDYETPQEAGWQSVWSDDFDTESLDSTIWTSDSATVLDGYLQLTAQSDVSAYIKSVEAIPQGRFEASIQVPAGSDIYTAFGTMPMADLYDGSNRINAFDSTDGKLIGTAQYGIGEINGVSYNSDANTAATTEFHTYSVNWDDDFIRWYLDSVHIMTIDRLNVWAYQLVDEEVVANTFSVGDPSGPFDQDMQIFLELTNNTADSVTLLVDYVNLWTCDTSVATELTNCAANLSNTIENAASDVIPTISNVTTDIFIDGVFDSDGVQLSDLETLTWGYTDEVVEISIANFNSPTIETIVLDEERDLVIDVSSASEDANIGIATPGIELIGHNVVLSFDMFIDSANTLTETFDIRMETGWPYMGLLVWNNADLVKDEWVTYSIPLSDFIDSPFLAPDWLTWIPNIVEGDALPLDPANINSLLTIEFHDAAHFQLDNIQISCVAAESCVQGPLSEQLAASDGLPSTVYEAEDYIAESGTELEDTADEGGGQNVGFIDAGDFLEYTITAPVDGEYSIDYRLASDSGSDGFEFSIDGIIVDIQTLESTGGWQEWLTQSSDPFTLSAGVYTARFDFIGGAININWFEIFEPLFEIFIEAEDYISESGTELEDTADEGGGQNVGFIDSGDFLEYTVNIPADGSYIIEYRLASESGSDGFEVSVAGTMVDSQTLEATGGWQEWASQTGEVDLVAGEQTLRLDFVGGAVNINWIKITR